MCILIGVLSCYIYNYFRKDKQTIPLLIIYCFIFSIVEIFFTPKQIFNSFKNQTLQNLFLPCIGIILLILSIYCIIKSYKEKNNDKN